ncbi:PEP-CTERM sorting domain-containing protein [Nitrosomonas oligotropha]|nr:PEP-CTERM sorting domain-containing protein [Nitrosomonas oligotropha]
MLLSPVPEPETYVLLLAGLGLIGFSLRNKKA